MSAKTLFIGLDASDPRLLEHWGADGTLPGLGSFFGQAARFELNNALAVIGGGVWQELNTGRSAGRAGLFFPARQLRTGESAPRQIERDEVDPRGFWTVASDAGKRVAVVDLPHTIPPPDLNGVFVTEWGTHDRMWEQASVPSALYAELTERHGHYPLWTRGWPRVTTAACDGHDGSDEQYGQLLDDLTKGIDQKTELLLDVLGREDWDLFACAFSEGQCSGHQLWHFHENPAGDGPLSHAIRSVYERLEQAVERLRAAAGDDATVFVVASHSFVRATGGTQLMSEVLVRLGYGSGRGASARARSMLPPWARRAIRSALPRGARTTLQTKTGALPHPLESPATRAAALDGDRCSWIRLNVRGREPHGSVEPGEEAAEIIRDIRTELLELRQPASGERIVATVQTAEEAFGPDHHPDVPDLIVNFRDDLGLLETCESSRVGLVRVPYTVAAHRSGAHPPVPSRLWMSGPRAPRLRTGSGNAVDLAPTILTDLDVPLPDWLDGSPLV